MMYDVLCQDCPKVIAHSSKQSVKELCDSCARKRQYAFNLKKGWNLSITGLTDEEKTAVELTLLPAELGKKAETYDEKILEALENSLKRDPTEQEIQDAKRGLTKPGLEVILAEIVDLQTKIDKLQKP